MNHSLIAATLLLGLCGGCQPLVVTPIDGNPAADDGGNSASGGSTGSTGSSGSSGSTSSGAGGATTARCGGDLPAHPSWVVATTADAGFTLAVDATSVYWASDQVWKAPKGGGTPVALAPIPQSSAAPWGVTVASGYVYWSDGDGLHKVPVGGGTPVLIGDGSYAYDLTADASTIYWTERGMPQPGRVMKAPLGGGTPTVIATLPGVRGSVVVDEASIYWDNQIGPIQKAPLAGGPVVTLAPAQNTKILALALGGGRIYWGGVNRGLGSVPIGGGTVTYEGTIAGGVAVDSGNVYWTDPDLGAVCKMPLGGGAPITLSAGHPAGAPTTWVVTSVAVDDTFAYWPDRKTNTIWRTLK